MTENAGRILKDRNYSNLKTIFSSVQAEVNTEGAQ